MLPLLVAFSPSGSPGRKGSLWPALCWTLRKPEGFWALDNLFFLDRSHWLMWWSCVMQCDPVCVLAIKMIKLARTFHKLNQQLEDGGRKPIPIPWWTWLHSHVPRACACVNPVGSRDLYRSYMVLILVNSYVLQRHRSKYPKHVCYSRELEQCSVRG